MAIRACPKKGPKPKKERRWLRRNKAPRKRGRFHAGRPSRFPPDWAWARQQQYNRIMQTTSAEAAVCAVLRNLGIQYEREHIVMRPNGRPLFVDVWVPSLRIGMELDGSHHRDCLDVYDIPRDQWIEKETGFKILRQWNKWATDPGLEYRLKSVLKLL